MTIPTRHTQFLISFRENLRALLFPVKTGSYHYTKILFTISIVQQGSSQGVHKTVNDRDSRRREIPAPGELFLPSPGRFSIFAGNLTGNY